MGRCVLLVGAFPPPLHGVSQVNSLVRDALLQLGVPVSCFDLSGKTLERTFWARLRRVGRVFGSLPQFLWSLLSRRDCALYVGISGGAGQVYEAIFLLCARALSCPVFLHHHSFAYLHSARPITRLLVWAAGRHANHVLLCDCMEARFRNCYGEHLLTRTISNAAIIAAPGQTPAGNVSHAETIGYLSNISKEKGIQVFLDTLDALQKMGTKVRGKIAGPFQDDEIAAIVLERVAESPWLEYVGPRYGSEKDHFFDSIDLLFFPTRYFNEAEPLTIHEAMARARPVLAIDRGCINELIEDGTGAVLDDGDDVAQRAAAVIAGWYSGTQAIQSLSSAAANTFRVRRAANLGRFDALCREIAGRPLN